MELTHQQKLVAAAMNAKGQAIDEIVAKTQADRESVEEFIKSRGGKSEQVREMYNQGVGVMEISRRTGVPQATVSNWVKKFRTEVTPEPETEKEPAPAEAETSPKEKYLQEYNTSVSGVCQVEAIANLFHHAERACKSMIDTYDTMTCEEQLAFDMGETYRDMLSVRNDLEKLMKAGERA